jgi:hypothetical protein
MGEALVDSSVRIGEDGQDALGVPAVGLPG